MHGRVSSKSRNHWMEYSAKRLSLVIAFASRFPLPASVITAVSATNELLDAQESPVGRALLARKPGRDSVIAHPHEIAETEICVAKIPEILDERCRDPVIARLEQLTGRQISEAEPPQRRNEIRRHAVVTQLLEVVERKILVSRVGETADKVAGHSVVPQTHEPMCAADVISGGTE